MTFTTLETRIEKAIAENVDPFTTDADIRFFETEELKTFMNDLWGAEGNFIEIHPLVGAALRVFVPRLVSILKLWLLSTM
jgi:hypothetical protein